jgi:hypothetical protein
MMRQMHFDARGRAIRGAVRHRRRFRVALHGYPASFTVDVGAGGFCVEVMRVLPTGTPLEGSILVDGSDLGFVGAVVWNRPGDPRIGLRGRMGIQFTSIPKEFAARMVNREAPR